MKIYVAGSLNMDLVIRAPYMPENGVTISGEGFLTNPGGKGANQAAAVGKLGGSVCMVGCVGDAFGNELRSALQGYGVDVTFVERTPGVSSGIAVIVVVDGDNRIILDAGANARVSRELIDRAFASAEAGDYLVTQLEIDRDITAYALRRAREKGMITLLNPTPAVELESEIFSNCDYFVVNQSEAEFYTGIYPEDEASARRCARTLMERGVQNVLITLGAAGSVCISGGSYYRAESIKVQAVDTTAAGDTYVGAFVTRLSEGADIAAAMCFASKAAAITVTRMGAQQSIPMRKEVE